MGWNQVEIHAKFAKLWRTIATARRLIPGQEAIARQADKEARKHEAILRDLATEIELFQGHDTRLSSLGASAMLYGFQDPGAGA